MGPFLKERNLTVLRCDKGLKFFSILLVKEVLQNSDRKIKLKHIFNLHWGVISSNLFQGVCKKRCWYNLLLCTAKGKNVVCIYFQSHLIFGG
jgi:hypothetical protein